MAVNFPNNPSSGQIHTEGNKSWQWLGNRWGAYNVQNVEAFAFRNKIINGNFDIWQRGTNFSITNSETYTSDRWCIVYDGTGATRTISRQPFSVGQTDVPNNPDYFLRWNQSVAGSGANFNVLRQPIESVKTLAGKQVVVTFYAKAASTLDVHVFFQQYFGTGGSPSPTLNVPGGTTINLNTSWQKYSVVCDITNLSGKSIGTNNNDYLALNFNPSPINDNATFTFDIAQVQLEEGPTATPFEQRPIGTELTLCQRYYEKNYNLNTPPATPLVGYDIHTNGVPTVNTFNNFKYNFSVKFQTRKRTTPTVTLYATDSGIGGNFSLGSPGSRVNIGVTTGGTNEIGFHTASVTNSLQSDAFLNFTANAEL